VYLTWTPWTIAWTALAVVTAVVLLFRTAPYGRHIRSDWGPTLPHRLGWIVMEVISPVALIAGLWWSIYPSMESLSGFQMGLVALWLGHYLYRALIYPYLMRWKEHRMPAVIMLSAVGFNLVNGGLNGVQIEAIVPPTAISPMMWVGLSLFVGGLAMNVHSDAILRSLRKPGESGYRIPEGGFYRWVTCPNYLGEMLEWTGFALLAATPAAVAFAVWTAANLIPRALSHHKWYKNQFAVYPRHRKAVIPFVL
jgi:protein-S-isoprenylcysteine O-methyltransferase Ste14